MEKDTRLKRSELYSRVWSKATTRVAEELGLSGRGLGKLCQRHDIPVPWRGYWARRQHGYTEKQTPLPPLQDNADPVVEIYGSDRPHTLPMDRDPKTQAEFDPENRVAVGLTLERPHRHLRKTASALRRRRKPDADGRLRSVGPDRFQVAVSPENAERSLKILNALCVAFENRGYAIRSGSENSPALRVVVDGMPVAFFLEERLSRVRYEPSPTEVAQAKRQPWFRIRKWAYVPQPVRVARPSLVHVDVSFETLHLYGRAVIRRIGRQHEDVDLARQLLPELSELYLCQDSRALCTYPLHVEKRVSVAPIAKDAGHELLLGNVGNRFVHERHRLAPFSGPARLRSMRGTRD